MTKQMTLEQLLRETIPYLRDEASHYEDDGSNEPLELARRIETALESGAHLNTAKGEAVAWRIVADADIWDYLNDDERDVLYFDKRDVPTGDEALGFTITPLYTHPSSPDVVRDAERYRWIRDQCDTTTGFLLCHRIEAEEWDAAIDAAMAVRDGGE